MSAPNWRRGVPVPPTTRVVDEEGYVSSECLDRRHYKCGDRGVCECRCHEPDDWYSSDDLMLPDHLYDKYFDALGEPRSAW